MEQLVLVLTQQRPTRDVALGAATEAGWTEAAAADATALFVVQAPGLLVRGAEAVPFSEDTIATLPGRLRARWRELEVDAPEWETELVVEVGAEHDERQLARHVAEVFATAFDGVAFLPAGAQFVIGQGQLGPPPIPPPLEMDATVLAAGVHLLEEHERYAAEESEQEGDGELRTGGDTGELRAWELTPNGLALNVVVAMAIPPIVLFVPVIAQLAVLLTVIVGLYALRSTNRTGVSTESSLRTPLLADAGVATGMVALVAVLARQPLGVLDVVLGIVAWQLPVRALVEHRQARFGRGQ